GLVSCGHMQSVPMSRDAADTSAAPHPAIGLKYSTLIRRPNGIEYVLRANVHLALADCRSRVDVRLKWIDRQNLPVAGRAQHDDLTMLAGDVHLTIDADGRGVVIFDRTRQTRLLQHLAGLGLQSGCDSSASNQVNDIVIDEG